MTHTPMVGSGLLGEDRLVPTPDGRELRLMLAGAGDDLVVLEAGLGVSGLYWGRVHAEIATHARVVAYERAGFGASTPDDGPRDLARLAADLETVIGAVPHRRLVLVGHSWGGPIIRVAAAGLRDRGAPPAGLVLIDQSDEHALSLYTSGAARWTDAIQRTVTVPLARLRLLGPLSRPLAAGLPRPLAAAVLAASTSVDAARATRAELAHVRDDLRGLLDAPPVLDGVALTVISGTRTNLVDARLRGRLLDAHRETVRRHPGARFVPAANSGHLVPLTDPELIATEAMAFLIERDER